MKAQQTIKAVSVLQPTACLFVVEYLRLARKHDPRCDFLHNPPFSMAWTDIGGEEAHLLGCGYRLDEVRPAYLVQPVFAVLALENHGGLDFSNCLFVGLQLPEAPRLSYEAVN